MVITPVLEPSDLGSRSGRALDLKFCLQIYTSSYSSCKQSVTLNVLISCCFEILVLKTVTSHSNKDAKGRSFKSNENIQKKEVVRDCTVSNNIFSSVTLHELAMKVKKYAKTRN